MKGIIDSSIWIALKSKDGELRVKSQNIIKEFLNNKIKEIYITDYVLLETINFLLRKTNFEASSEVYKGILENTNIIYIDELMIHEILEIFKKYKDLSITDCSLILLCNKKEIKEIYSFDSGFDKVKGIIRKEAI